MEKIIYIMGKSASGKDTIYRKIKEYIDAESYVMYTTRPIRNGEIEGKTYNYITSEQMQEYKEGAKKEKLIEHRSYITAHGVWEYATINDGQFTGGKDIIMLGTLESYEKVNKYFKQENLKEKYKVIPVYVEVEDGERLIRAIRREQQEEKPKYKELCRRFIADAEDFSEEKLKNAGIEKRFLNNDFEECVAEILNYIGQS